MPSLPKPGEVKIFSTQLLSTGSLGPTLVAYMPSHSWPLHRHTCTNDLIKTCAFEVRILTVSHTHACTHALLYWQTSHRAVQHASQDERFCLSRGQRLLSLVCLTLAWGSYMSHAWGELHENESQVSLPDSKKEKSMWWVSETYTSQKGLRWDYNISVSIIHSAERVVEIPRLIRQNEWGMVW